MSKVIEKPGITASTLQEGVLMIEAEATADMLLMTEGFGSTTETEPVEVTLVRAVLSGEHDRFARLYEMYAPLWLPIGIHIAWNLLSGPVLGYHVSGYVPRHTVLTVSGGGPDWLTGGWFGIEASAWLVVVEIAGIAFLTRISNFELRMKKQE